MTINEYLGSRFRELREKAGLSLREAGARVGMNWGTMFNYESGRRAMPLDIVNKLANFYGVSAGQILSDTLDLMNEGRLEDGSR
ncbi:MAG: helix-turn-helix transcriptional regulator [Lachnospiraceae bacterium]|nr:helix-turn-helix transcriptional regulator [Oscillospiraceae bacterium]MBR3279286.1 helix-turn-helix transcriptional regulator [Lachnospiraceae bacterium]